MEVKLCVRRAVPKMLLFFLNMMLFAMLSFISDPLCLLGSRFHVHRFFVFIFKHVYVQLC